jgi:hypothetical protein
MLTFLLHIIQPANVSSDYDIYAKRITPNGEIIAQNDIPISVGLNEASYFPSVAIDENNLLVVWIALRGGSSEIYCARVTKNGVWYKGESP